MTGDPGPTVIVVPCFNEETRIDENAFLALASAGVVRLLFVDDGSTDGTGKVLARLADASEAVDVLTMTENAGKAEAVRNGLLEAVRVGAAVVGYYDADMATPPEELLRLTHSLHARADLAGVLGSRVARLGSTIERGVVRHYLGRAYATVASMALGITVYDTQCGAKVFRVNETFVASLVEPFRSSWALDVELLHRLLRGSGTVPGLPVTDFEEVPLERWRDVPGSKMRIGAGLSALLDLAVIARSRIGHASGRVGPDPEAPPLSAGDDPHRERA